MGAEPGDASLAEAWRSGDRAAFAALVERFEGRLMSYLVHISGSRAEAEDLFQETFLRVFRERENLNPDAPFAFTLMRIARNLAISRHRRQTVERKDLEERARRPKGMPEDESAGGEASAAVHRALALLPEELREPVALRIWGGLGWREVAEVLGCSEDTAARRFAEALKALREDLR